MSRGQQQGRAPQDAPRKRAASRSPEAEAEHKRSKVDSPSGSEDYTKSESSDEEPVFTCGICYEEKAAQEMVEQLTRRCKHRQDVWRHCATDYIGSAVDIYTRGNDCPGSDCKSVLRHSDVRSLGSPEVFERYDTRMTHNTLNKIENFYYCQNSAGGCKSGQIHENAEAEPIFTCNACGSQCHHEFCWRCLASYARIRREGNKAHLPKCPYAPDNLPSYTPSVLESDESGEEGEDRDDNEDDRDSEDEDSDSGVEEEGQKRGP
ncbi:hypothetical protein LTS18_008779 [Coniosporium uncinatum]|uniref:Uncharacterized protein n=1 Tax=Coniosporium uncinatum TaxID=93489 RepID=A0ACC3DA52_9PEZI|nr:hypothetical protein LTS18_008779 [Coniosporium uncinatum]